MKQTGIIAFIVFTLLVGCASGGKGTTISGVVSLDEGITGAVVNIESRVNNNTEITIANFETFSNALSDFLVGELSANLISSGKFIVLERNSALDAVNAEHQFQMSGFVNDSSAVGIGHYLGAKVVITGNFSRFADFNQISLRAIDVRTSQLLALYIVRIQPDDTVLVSTGLLNSIAAPAITEKALIHLNQAKNILSSKTNTELGWILNKNKIFRELDRALSINSNLGEAYIIRGRLHWAISFESRNLNSKKAQKYADMAMSDLTAALDIQPDHFQSLQLRTYIYMQRGNYDQAIADLNVAYNFFTDNSSFFVLRGDTYCRKGNFDLAIEDYEAALRINPNSNSAIKGLETARKNR
ncbi:MAG: tetratricopeptide repeat protein [Treponema sp.]|nr:tetratricopeptide repeat protein [Treponema sp.]